MKHFRKLLFVMGVFSILALLPEFAAAQNISQVNPSNPRGGERFGSFAFNPATVNWKSKTAAITLVEQQLAQLEVQIANQFPGTTAYFQVDIRRSYYKLVLSEIELDVPVKDAVINSGKGVSRSYPTASVSLLNTLVNEAAQLLSN